MIQYITENKDDSKRLIQLMIYITGSSAAGAINLTFSRAPVTQWPVTHTCIRTMEVPQYDTYQTFKTMLNAVLSNDDAVKGFGFV